MSEVRNETAVEEVLLASELGLDRAAAAALAEQMSPVRLDRDEFLCLQGEPSDRFFVVRSGALVVQTSSRTGKELVFTTLFPGAPIGEVSVFDGSPRSAAIRAIEPSEVLAIGRVPFIRTVGQHPTLGLALAAYLARTVRRLTENVEGTSFLPLAHRLAELIEVLAIEGAGAERLDDEGAWFVVATQQAMADRLGASRESVNKVLRGWQNDGLVEIGRGRLRVADPAALLEVARR